MLTLVLGLLGILIAAVLPTKEAPAPAGLTHQDE